MEVDVVGGAAEATDTGVDEAGCLTDVEDKPAATAAWEVDVTGGAAAGEEVGWFVEMRAGDELPPVV